ncbi:tripartite tricarboxylate transporter TctB family protein [Pseudonocardia sp. DSM 110487]|uniref:tripartite tricarboxylate transporter TctB family protein n=1 Tax=Pseudonocardia sp. DSM 110487 TaxID=2865833 RepID=UPI001C6993D9|nr:tripartite tricarboxylate transporter TctB family protein [Pseudonocardia sp. DSM 110487]QYN38986.1 tripartite tricarboxylate transporter TctB family protein [Pseudonocardia sp. DSM 110487]
MTGAAPWAHRIAALAFLAVAVGVLTGAFTIDQGTTYQAVGPRVFPLLVGAGMCLVSAIGVVQAFRGTDTDQIDQLREEIRATHWPSVVLLVAALIGYVLLLTPLGYWQTTTVFFVAVARVLGSRKLVRDAIIGLVLALAVYMLFDRLLGIGLPPGIVRLAI